LLTGLYAMATAEHREPCDSRGSCTVLGAPGGETPSGDSSIAIACFLCHVRSCSKTGGDCEVIEGRDERISPMKGSRCGQHAKSGSWAAAAASHGGARSVAAASAAKSLPTRKQTRAVPGAPRDCC